jgi:2-amino-4-hydroxy-6-hydroxymethyldihydropteridine diphosphokinase
MSKAFLALGSNLENPIDQVKRAIIEISKMPDSMLIAQSSLYRTLPEGVVNQPVFINAVVEISTDLSPENLLAFLQGIEQKHNRIRTVRHGPRTLDLDILLYDQQVINQENLQIPHPRLTERAFVLLPLYELAPNLILPDGKPISYWLQTVDCSEDKITKIQEEIH